MMKFVYLAVDAWNAYIISVGGGTVWNWIAAALMFGMFFAFLIEDSIRR